jgi:hypothetical protein
MLITQVGEISNQKVKEEHKDLRYMKPVSSLHRVVSKQGEMRKTG